MNNRNITKTFIVLWQNLTAAEHVIAPTANNYKKTALAALSNAEMYFA